MNQAALQQVREFNPFYSPAAYAPPVQKAASPKKSKPSPFTGNETLEEAKSICKSKKKVFRKGYTRQDGSIIEPACVKKSPSTKSPSKKSPSKKSTKSCGPRTKRRFANPLTPEMNEQQGRFICDASGYKYRKAYNKGDKLIPANCVRKSVKSPSKCKSSPKKSAKKSSPKKSGKKSCPSGKVYRKSYKSASGKRVAAKCVKKGGPKKSTRKSTKKSSPRKSCQTGKVYRKGYKSPGKKRVAGKCVKKGGPKK